MPRMKIAAVQMVSTPDVALNLEAAARGVAQAALAGARLVLLPEYFCLMGLRDSDKLAHAEPATADGQTPRQAAQEAPIQQFLARTAQRHGLWLVGGTLPVSTDDPAQVLNRCCVFGPDGRQLAHYDKMHLFSFDDGRERYDEGRTLRAGGRAVAFTLPGDDGPWRVGLSICYDLRFPELYRALSHQPGQPPCDLLLVPAAFTYTTGRAHWELLLRARAVENQCTVLAAAQGGRHDNGRRTWGHSMVVDAWGEVQACVPEGEGVALAVLDRQRQQALREQLPALRHRRL
jgi:predicted amidohydrolase